MNWARTLNQAEQHRATFFGHMSVLGCGSKPLSDELRCVFSLQVQNDLSWLLCDRAQIGLRSAEFRTPKPRQMEIRAAPLGRMFGAWAAHPAASPGVPRDTPFGPMGNAVCRTENDLGGVSI